MSDYNLIPDFPKWFWMLLGAIFFIGLGAIVAAIGYGIVWLCFHIKIA